MLLATLGALAVGMLIAPAASIASTAGPYAVVAGPGERNTITITNSGSTFTITDTAGVTADLVNGCSQDSPTQATCTTSAIGVGGLPAAPIIEAGDGDDRVQVNLSNMSTVPVNGGDGNDTLDASANTAGETLSGGAGNDNLIGGPRATSASGDAGDDRISGGDGHDALRGGAGADTIDGGEGSDLIITLLDPSGSSNPNNPADSDDNTVDTVTCGGNAPPAALLPGEAGPNPNLPPVDGAQTGQGDLVGADCEEVLAIVTCPTGTCAGLPTVTTTAPAGAATAVASAAGNGQTQVLGRARRKVKVRKGQKLVVTVRMNRKSVKKALGKRSSLPARLGLQNRSGKNTGRKVRFKLKH
jgi:Ca2+-binding RTX toxin-like protein